MEFFQKLFNRLLGAFVLVFGIGFSIATRREFPFNLVGVLVALIGLYCSITATNPYQVLYGYSGRTKRKYSKEEEEEKIIRAGMKGEKELAYALNWLDESRFKVYKNIRLSNGNESQEFDSIVVGDRAIFNIEVKNYNGDLIIDEDGNWYRVIDGRKKGMESPVFQVKRHNKVLDTILEGKVPIVDLIVWANVNSVLEGLKYSPVKVIKVDQVMHYIDTYNDGIELTYEEIEFITEKLKKEVSAL